jgi:tagaturonate reductase
MLGSLTNPILQFGTSRFLLAHVDLFVSQALDRGTALGGITVVQTTASAQSTSRLAALGARSSYPVRIRGLQDGQPTDHTLSSFSIRGALHADQDWLEIRTLASYHVKVIVSNTGDAGYALNAADEPSLIGDVQLAPRSFPAKLLALLYARWQIQPSAPLTLLPCELVSRNGDTLRDLVLQLATRWQLAEDFLIYVDKHCVWANSVVDRIVSEALQPVGAVAEPYALWAIERQVGLVLPCNHAAIVLTDDLGKFERFKLYLLNLAHTYLAQHWLSVHGGADETVLQAMNNLAVRADLELVWAEEVLPVFDALGEGAEARAYIIELRDRLCNPFLNHRLADIAQNHVQKVHRRLAPVVALARDHGLTLAQSRLRAVIDQTSGA